MNTEFEIGQQVEFKKLKGGRIISGNISKFTIDKATGKIYAVISSEDKKYTVQVKKLNLI